MDIFWSDRFRDNFYKSIIAQLEQIIDECDDPQILSKIGSSLKFGLGGRAINKSNKILSDMQELEKELDD